MLRKYKEVQREIWMMYAIFRWRECQREKEETECEIEARLLDLEERQLRTWWQAFVTIYHGEDELDPEAARDIINADFL